MMVIVSFNEYQGIDKDQTTRMSYMADICVEVRWWKKEKEKFDNGDLNVSVQ